MSAVSAFWAHTVARLNRLSVVINVALTEKLIGGRSTSFVAKVLSIFTCLTLSFGTVAYAQTTTTSRITFTYGFIGEYPTGSPAQSPYRAQLLNPAPLNIRSVVLSQTNTDGRFIDTGTQGNDVAVDITINFSDSTIPATCTGAVNWLDKSGSFIEGIGVTVTNCNDRYTASTGYTKTYLLRTSTSTRIYQSTAFGVEATYTGTRGEQIVSGSADGKNTLLAALNAELAVAPPPTPPVITGPSGGAGAAASAITVDENQTGATQLLANEVVTWSITGGADQNKFQIASNGTITFRTAPDFEDPTDSDQNNTYVLTVSATDADGNVATQTVTVTVRNLDEIAPVITGPTGGPGAAASAVPVDEDQTAVTQLSADEPVTWSITGGADQSMFQIVESDGTITFRSAPDFEDPKDSDRDNIYVLTVTATDASGNVATQTVTVTVLDIVDSAPVITGPTGGPGATASADTVDENQTGATQLSANKAVAWLIAGGSDQGMFQISSTGTITFLTAPDFEDPKDSDRDNIYVLIVTATDTSGNVATQTVTVTVRNLDDTPPAISGPSGGPGDPQAEITVNEGQTAVTKLTASEGVVWTISSGNDAGKFQIASDGTITFVAAPDYENPTDGGTNNTYILTVTATDQFGNVSTQTITVNIANLDDSAPLITGPSGGAGAAESAISVNENQTAVTRVTANEAVTWTITGGSESTKFQIEADGTITFVAAPDYERPTDADTNNTYVLVITATDSARNQSSQTMTVTVVDLDDAAPVITGPNGGAGAAASAITINEGLTAVTTFAANERVTWSILSGDDSAGFTIDPATGAIAFRAAQDYENPTDADRNNTHIVRIRAVDAAGNASIQTLTVTIANVDEIARKIAEISGRLRGGLRNYAMHSLGDMLSFNEGLMQGADDNDRDCGNVQQNKALSGSINANEANQQANMAYAKDVSQCGRPYRVLLNTSLAVSRFAGDLNSRALGSIRVERKVGSDIVLGVGIMSSTSNDSLASFGDSEISDTSLQLNVYGRARLADTLRGGAFWGIGKSWYDFELRDGGLDLNGKMSGNRYVYGAMLSGDLVVKGVTITTDAILSRAVEHLGDAKLAAAYLGEKRSGIAFAVGSVDTTRLSVPVTGQFVLSDTQANDGRVTKLLLSPGLLCEDTSVDASAMECGYQLGAKLNSRLSDRGAAYFDFKFESVSGLRRNLFGIGYAHQFGAQNAVEVAFDVNHGVSEMTGSDNRAMVRVRLVR